MCVSESTCRCVWLVHKDDLQENSPVICFLAFDDSDVPMNVEQWNRGVEVQIRL